jgi:hypothetical protein
VGPTAHLPLWWPTTALAAAAVVAGLAVTFVGGSE